MAFIFSTRWLHLGLLTTCFFIWSGTSLPAQSLEVLQVLPSRVLLDKNRYMTLTLVNRGVEEGSYRLYMRNIRTTENGEFVEITEAGPGDLFADKMISFSPRRVTVPGQNKQDIRVVVRKPKNLADGEYRSHLVFRSLPKQASVLDSESIEKQVSVSITPVIEVSIPVIVRQGDLHATPTLIDATLVTQEDKSEQIKVTLEREGNRSLYGSIQVWDGENLLAEAEGITVYVPNQRRITHVNLFKEGPSLRGRKVKVIYKEDPIYGGETSTSKEVVL